MGSLLERIAGGDRDALSEIYRTYGKAVRYTALQIVGSPTEADDVLQDVMVKILTSASSFRPGTDERAWIFRVTKNCAIDRLRKREREPAAADVGETPAPQLREEERMDLEQALSLLSETDRKILRLKVYVGYSHGEIARLLGMTASQVRKRYSRALSFLRERLEDVT